MNLYSIVFSASGKWLKVRGIDVTLLRQTSPKFHIQADLNLGLKGELNRNFEYMDIHFLEASKLLVCERRGI